VADRNTRAGGELGRVLDRGRAARCGIRKELVDDAQVLGGGRAHRFRVGDQVHRLGQADQAGKTLGAARSREQSEVHLRQADLVRTFRGETQVACEGELETTAQAV